MTWLKKKDKGRSVSSRVRFVAGGVLELVGGCHLLPNKKAFWFSAACVPARSSTHRREADQVSAALLSIVQHGLRLRIGG